MKGIKNMEYSIKDVYKALGNMSFASTVALSEISIGDIVEIMNSDEKYEAYMNKLRSWKATIGIWEQELEALKEKLGKGEY